MRFAQPSNEVVEIALERDLADILAAHRKVMTNCNSAAGAKWQLIAHSVVLKQCPRNAVGLRGKAWANGGIADSKSTDSPRRRQISFDQDWRYGQSARDIVKALIGVIRWEQRRAVNVETKKIAYGVDVLSAVQPMAR